MTFSDEQVVRALAAYYDDDERAFTQQSIDRMRAALETTYPEELTLDERATLADKLSKVILAEQHRIAALPDNMKVRHGAEATAWQYGMSNARRIVRQALLTNFEDPT